MSQPDRRERLEVDQEILEAAIIDCKSMRDLPSLIREHRAVLAELDAIPNKAEVSDADEIAARRAARRTSASRAPRAQSSGH